MSATGIIFEDGRSSTDSLPKAENQRDGLSPCLDTSAPHRSVRGFSALMPDCMGPISETHCESFISVFYGSRCWCCPMTVDRVGRTVGSSGQPSWEVSHALRIDAVGFVCGSCRSAVPAIVLWAIDGSCLRCSHRLHAYVNAAQGSGERGRIQSERRRRRRQAPTRPDRGVTMNPKAEQSPSRRLPKDRTTVRVDLNGRGAWEVALPDRRESLTCETLDEARRLASQYASRRRPCELIVCDAYHRVLHHELLNGQASTTPSTAAAVKHSTRARGIPGHRP
jgi:hypothetical protein